MWAHLENNIVKELTDIDPFERYPEDYIWVTCPDTVQVGDMFVEDNFVTPEPEVFKPDKAFVEKQRLLAYADPITGSDRYFSEAQAAIANGYLVSSDEVKSIKQKGVDRRNKIRELFPYSS